MPALKKVEECWETTKACFLNFLPKEQSFKVTSKNESYISICHNLNNETRILIQMAFVVDLSVPYMNFLENFQTEGLMVHVLFTELKNLRKTITKRFIKSDPADGKNAKTLLGQDIEKQKDFHLPLEKMEVGGKTTKLLAKLSAFDQKREKEKC